MHESDYYVIANTSSFFVTGAEIGDLDSKVSVTRCTKAPCRLKKGTQVDVDMKLKLGSYTWRQNMEEYS